MAIRDLGPMPAELERDFEGHRTYTVKYKMTSDDVLDGPTNVVIAFDELYPVGTNWNIGNDIDIWAFRLFGTKVTCRGSENGEKTKHWLVEATYSTKNPLRCSEHTVENPLLEPPRISGSYKTSQEEFTTDRFANVITNSAHEPLKGPKVEFDRSYLTIRIEQDVASPFLAYELPYQMMDCVNAFPLWGFKPRCVKLSSAPWERKYYGTCFPYYVRTLEFDLNWQGFDRIILDEGTKVLHGHWGGSFRRLGTITSGSDQVTGLAITTNLLDSTVSGTGIPSLPSIGGQPQFVRVREVTSSTTLTLTHNATASGAVLLTFENPNWILDNIAGVPPDSGNPRHFDRYVDRQGNPSTVILNGFGVPAGSVQNSRGFNQYMVAPNDLGMGVVIAGIPTTDNRAWVRIVVDPPDSDLTLASLTVWDSVRIYTRGQVVSYLNDLYISTADNNLAEFPDNELPFWVPIPNPPVNRGVYDATATYIVGDYVTVASDVALTSAGSITVQAYNEVDFLLLGIPTTF